MLLVGLVACGQVESSQAPPSGTAAVTVEELRDKVSYLSSDRFRGRGNGTEELDAAAEYIAYVFAEAGLEPVGNDGFFQEFEVHRPDITAGETFVRVERDDGSETALRVGADFVPFTMSPNGEVTAPMTFAGYGIQFPEQGYDDLAGIDLQGRIAVVLESFPRDREADSVFNVLSDVDLSSVELKVQNVARRGAVGVILVQGPFSVNGTSVRYYAQSMRPGLSPRESVMDLAPGPGGPDIPVVIVAPGSSSELIRGLGDLQLSIDEGLRPASTALPGTATIRVDMALNPYTARNVVARIPGSDPDLGEEAIVVGAHYDHDGSEGDRIWNGADDNASGTSALLELAEAFGSGPRPARSVILAAWAAEEKGMVGSRAYARNPAVPLENTVAMFQIDMIGRNEHHPANPAEGFEEELASENGNALNMIGSVFSPDLRQVFEASNEDVGLDLRFRYDYRAQNLLRRSDHWTFLSQSIPAIFLFGGLHPDYHTPNDTADKINYEKIRKVVELVHGALEDIGNAEGVPQFVDPPDSPE